MRAGLRGDPAVDRAVIPRDYAVIPPSTVITAPLV